MVFRGKPSKACQRCRARRLKCDLQTGSCGQCIRANMMCAGYRDTQQLRVQNESQTVMRKSLLNNPPSFEPRSLTLPVDLQARDAFFAYYVTSTSKSWDFLKRFYHPADSADHLNLSIEAVSLAYLSHEVHSDVALAAGRDRYISALRLTNKALQSPKAARKESTLLASLLLDLFEKITNSEPRNNKSWTSHVHGALALVRLRGFEQFRDASELRVLLRLSINLLISCVASGSSVPAELVALRAYAGMYLDVRDPKWQLSNLMVEYANLTSAIQRNHLSNNECIKHSLELDEKLYVFDLGMPPSWQYQTTLLDHNSERVYGLYFHSYPDRNVTQARNVLRLIRILLNESFLENHLAFSPGDTSGLLVEKATSNIEALTHRICASAPQYIDCFSQTRGMLPTLEKSEFVQDARGRVDHPHTPNHKLDCYTLIFPLYVAGRSKYSPPSVKMWVIDQLHYMSSHFCIRNAEVVAQILRDGTSVNPWKVYAMLGSYAFAA